MSSALIHPAESIRCVCVEIILSNGIPPLGPVSPESSLAAITPPDYNINCIQDCRSSNILNSLRTTNAVLGEYAVLQATAIKGFQ